MQVRGGLADRTTSAGRSPGRQCQLACSLPYLGGSGAGRYQHHRRPPRWPAGCTVSPTPVRPAHRHHRYRRRNARGQATVVRLDEKTAVSVRPAGPPRQPRTKRDQRREFKYCRAGTQDVATGAVALHRPQERMD